MIEAMIILLLQLADVVPVQIEEPNLPPLTVEAAQDIFINAKGDVYIDQWRLDREHGIFVKTHDRMPLDITTIYKCIENDCLVGYRHE